MASTLDEICREGARRMLAAALELEGDEYTAALVDEFDERGRRFVTRNGYARPRTITTAAERDRVGVLGALLEVGAASAIVHGERWGQ